MRVTPVWMNKRLNTWLRRCAAILALVGMSVSSHAETLPSDLRVFPLSVLDQSISSEALDYQLILGSVVKIDRRVRSDNELRLSGELRRITWEIPRSHQPEEPFLHMRNQLIEQGAQILYECEGRECGASNIWANDLFSNATLYGRDTTQRYLAAQLNGDHYAVYAVRRGNQRVYFHMDILLGDQADQSWNIALEQQGYTLLPSWPESPDVAAKTLADWMKASDAQIRLVVHQQGSDVELSQRKAQRLASTLEERLIAEGVDPLKLEVFGLGPLAPSVLGARQQVAEVIWVR